VPFSVPLSSLPAVDLVWIRRRCRRFSRSANRYRPRSEWPYDPLALRPACVGRSCIARWGRHPPTGEYHRPSGSGGKSCGRYAHAIPRAAHVQYRGHDLSQLMHPRRRARPRVPHSTRSTRFDQRPTVVRIGHGGTQSRTPHVSMHALAPEDRYRPITTTRSVPLRGHGDNSSPSSVEHAEPVFAHHQAR